MRINLQGRTSPVLGAVISNIQTGIVNLGTSESSDTTTITSVDTSQTILLHNGTAFLEGGTSANFNQFLAYLFLTNSTTVTAFRNTTGGDAEVRFTVIEFSSGINSIQRGTITIPAAPSFTRTKTVTISSVDTAKTFVNYIGHKQTNSSIENLPNVWLLDSTTVKAYCNNVNNTTVVSYEVIEFE